VSILAVLERLWFLRSLPEVQHSRYIHLILDGCATHRGDIVLALADVLDIVLPFIPPGLTELLPPLDRSVLGALKLGYRAIYRYEMSQRRDKRMSKADCAAYPFPGGTS
jgi:hypothetical protein